MRVDELIRILETYPRTVNVTVSCAPGERLEIAGHTASLEHDGGELCQPCEAILLAGEAWHGLDLDRVAAEADGRAA
ncbi:MAG: hypothetical protein ACE5MI_08915 [Acidimicrobiia bacterium]